MTYAEELWTADIADAKAAHALEDDARAIVAGIKGGQKALDTAWAAEPKGDGRRTSRAPAAMALRRAVRGLPWSVAVGKARALIAAADDRYWSMVLRHQSFLIRECNRLANTRDKQADEWQDVMQLLRLGWYRAAVRFDPDRGRRFPTMAASWGRQYVALHRDHGQITRVNPKTELREAVPSTLSFDGPRYGGMDDGAVTCDPFGFWVGHETVPAESNTPEAIENTAEISMQMRVLARYVRRLPEHQRRAVHLRYLDGKPRTHLEVGHELGITKQGAQQAEKEGLNTIRAWMAEDGLISVGDSVAA